MGNRTSMLAWHGWQFSLPEEWSPVRIDGDWNKGSILIADFNTTRVALRWQTAPRRKFEPENWTKQAIGAEVGQLMLAKSIDHLPGRTFSAGRLFVEPEPPGRDIWVGQSSVSGRLLEVVYQTKSLSQTLRDQILPAIADQPVDAPQRWSIFDLSCTAPGGWPLKSPGLNAGDLTLSFGKKNDVIIVRQLAPATLALARQPLEKWLDAQQRVWKKMYRIAGAIDSVKPYQGGGPLEDRTLIERVITRRKRFFLVHWVARERVTLAAHDRARDRIVLIDASTREVAMDTLASVGKAGT